MARKKAVEERACKAHGSHPLTAEFWYLYEGRSAICRAAESARQAAKSAAKKASVKKAARKRAKPAK